MHPDASLWAKRTLDEAMERKADIIKDGTLNNAKNLETLLDKASENGYKAEIQIKAVNAYESLEGVFGRYANQYAKEPSEARFVPPSYVKESKVKIEQTAEKIQSMDVDAFKVIDRDGNTIYDQDIHREHSAQKMMQEATDLKNYPKEKQELLQEKWQHTVEKLKEVNAPAHIQRSAKEIQAELHRELHPVQSRVMSKESAIIAGGIATHMATDSLGQGNESTEHTKPQTTPNGTITLSSPNNTTHGDDIIRADENNQTQSCSLLPPDITYDNRQIAEFDTDTQENNLTQETQKEDTIQYTDSGVILPASSGIYRDEKDIEWATDSNTNQNNNDNDGGMER